MDETKESSRVLYREKLAALNQAKENATQEKERELDRMKERLEQVKEASFSGRLPREEFQRFLVYKQVNEWCVCVWSAVRMD